MSHQVDPLMSRNQGARALVDDRVYGAAGFVVDESTVMVAVTKLSGEIVPVEVGPPHTFGLVRVYLAGMLSTVPALVALMCEGIPLEDEDLVKGVSDVIHFVQFPKEPVAPSLQEVHDYEAQLVGLIQQK